MLPSAPTVIVFAREYDQPSATLAALQFLCLLLAVPPANPNPSPNPNPNPNPNPSQVPFLLVSTAALQLPMVVGDEASRLIKAVSGWLATLGAAAAVLVMLLLLAASARAALPATLRR